MIKAFPFPPGSLIFAPMEGVTDEVYRLTIKELFPEWDYFNTDFLRIPTQGRYPSKKFEEHIGPRILLRPDWLNKTCFQILTSARAQTIESVRQILKFPIKHLDLNLGCPSAKVNAHLGGAYLLSDLEILSRVLKDIRETFPHHFSVKIRIGYKNTDNYELLLETIEKAGVDSITIHGRTREQLYKGKADWSYIKKAVDQMSIPVIGNGDIWTVEDIENMLEQTGCHSVMLGRGALKTPWLATQYKEYGASIGSNDAFLLEERRHYIRDYFNKLEKNYKDSGKGEEFILRRFKSFSRYLFEDFDDAEALRSNFLRSRRLDQFNHHLDQV